MAGAYEDLRYAKYGVHSAVMAFADHFSESAARYAVFRPTYDPEMIRWIAALVSSCDLAWDAGTGNGQAAVLLAEHFTKVIATDPSEAQLSSARQHPRVEYRPADERAAFLADASVDLVTVAQAIHWFDLNRFYAEVNRVLKPNGVIAVWSYGRPSIDERIDPTINWFHDERVGPMWPKERYEVESGYGKLPFPFDEIPTEKTAIQRSMPRDAFVGYIETWSAVRQFRLKEGFDPVPDFVEQLSAVWASGERVVSWPVSMRVGRARRP